MPGPARARPCLAPHALLSMPRPARRPTPQLREGRAPPPAVPHVPRPPLRLLDLAPADPSARAQTSSLGTRPRSASAGLMGLTSNSTVRVEWIAAVSLAAGTAVIGYLAYKKFLCKDKHKKSMVNLHIQKDNPKVVHAFDMEDLGDKAVYCRCWRSKKFPFCDGAHTKHNEETGDNVGPLIIKKKEA
ncbi:CDGSH iron-sulfur domain-containing protein 1 [Tachyglossus aculeatus]|uniref:CDGSH iron-sulfur domain-containing protein 1 n=1 Tax=Tachyglossus aculeatus TaxID=9261 RepID=UPI0018F4E423|nr:CDGSH iron-sulfur domain-containing protein 1 [Tachyglossus aculeatus]